MTEEDQQQYRYKFMEARLIELKTQEKELIEEMMLPYEKSAYHDLKDIKKMIALNEMALLTLHEGEEDYMLEN